MKKLWIAAGVALSAGITALCLTCNKKKYVTNHDQAVNRLKTRAKHTRPI